MVAAAKDVASEAKLHPGLWGVKDMNAQGTATRVHEPVAGVKVPLSSVDFTWMEPGHAAKFLCDDAFHVVNDKGVRQLTLPEQEVLQAGRKRLELPEGQVIAELEELTQEALYRRAARLPGGENLSPRASRAAMIKFIRDNEIGPGTPPEEAEDNELENADEAASRILQGD